MLSWRADAVLVDVTLHSERALVSAMGDENSVLTTGETNCFWTAFVSFCLELGRSSLRPLDRQSGIATLFDLMPRLAR